MTFLLTEGLNDVGFRALSVIFLSILNFETLAPFNILKKKVVAEDFIQKYRVRNPPLSVQSVPRTHPH